MRFKQLSSAVLILFLLASCGGGGGSSGGGNPPPPPPPPVVNDDAPVMSSTNTVVVAENSTAVLTLTATDSDSPVANISFTLGGTDASLFNIVSTNRLVFSNAPDFEDPMCGSGSNQNSCQITITPSDGTNTGTAQAITVTVTDVDETTPAPDPDPGNPGGGGPPPPADNQAPIMTSANTASVAENSVAVLTLAATDADSPAASISFTLGGTDASLFNIVSTNRLVFKSAPNFEARVCGNNQCQVTITPSDGTNSGAAQTISVTVTNLNDSAPIMSSANTANVPENSVAVLTLTATDADNLAGQTQSFSLGGTDASLFNIVSTNRLVFKTAPDFENPICGGDNVCQISITPTDGTNRGTAQAITIRVTNLNDGVAPAMTSANSANPNENTNAVLISLTATDADSPDADTNFTLGGTDASLFEIVSNNRLQFKTAPDFENPICGGDNICQITVTPSDGTNTGAAQAITITVVNLNDEAPIMTSPSTVNVPENSTAVFTLTATDADNIAGQTQEFSLGGTDAALFSIINDDRLVFDTAPDFEGPAICGGDNSCDITITPTDGTNSGVAQMVTVMVVNANDIAPVMTVSSPIFVDENSAAPVVILTASDADNIAGQMQGFSLFDTGFGSSANNDLFSIINGNQLVFINSPPDNEMLRIACVSDPMLTARCILSVVPNDGINTGALQSISVRVRNLNDEAPVMTSPDTASVLAGTVAVFPLTATDADNISGQTQSFSLGGTDANVFNIINDDELVFKTAPVFDSTICGGDNRCDISITPTDGTNSGVAQAIAISIEDTLPILMAFDTTVAEGNAGTTTLHTVSLYLPYGTASVSYFIVGGVPGSMASSASIADNDWSLISPASGTLNFNAGGTETITIQIIGDSKAEANETVQISLTNPINLELLNSVVNNNIVSTRISITIINDDLLPIHNDSGVLYSGEYPSGNASGCLSNLQDCAHGRDVDASTDTFVKVGGGQVGFDFTKLGQSGKELAIQTATYTALSTGSETTGTIWFCVRDNHTGLVWQVHTDYDPSQGASNYDKDNTYQWGGTTALGREPTADRRGNYRDDWNALVSGANTTSLCGFTDWRVPKVLELLTIAHSGRESPSIDTNYFPHTQDFSDTDEAYWSATPVNRINASAWAVTFANGANAFNNSNRTLELRVRLVRGGDFDNSVVNEWPDSRYIVHADNTVTDTRTNLMWQRCSVGQDQTTAGCTGTVTTNHTWATALQRVQTANLNSQLGFDDWRLPNVRELLTLVAYDRNRPAINSTIFPRTEHSSSYASSTPTPIISSSLVDRFYNVSFGDGADNPNSRRNFAGYAVRLVRDVD